MFFKNSICAVRDNAAVRQGAAIFVILACALFLRAYHLNAYDLWFDELGTNLFSSVSLNRMAEVSSDSVADIMAGKIRNDPHSFLYLLLVHIYSAVAGDGKSLRVISVVFSTLSLGVFYKLSRLFFDRRVSLYALLLMAVNPFHLWYAQEARVYAMACFFSLLATYCYFKVLKTDKLTDWFLFSIVSVLAVYSSYYFLILFFTLARILLVRRYRPALPKWIVSLLIVLISLVLLRSFWGQQWDFVKNDFWLPIPMPAMLLFTGEIFSLGYTATTVQYWVGVGVFFSLFIYGVFSCHRDENSDALILLPLLLFPIFAVYIFSKIFMPIYIHRQLIIFSPFYYLFIARGIAGIRHHQLRFAVALGPIVLITLSLINYYRGVMVDRRDKFPFFIGTCSKGNYSELLDYLDREFKEGDLVVTAELQAYLIVFSHILKQEDRLPRIPMERFQFWAYPDAMFPFERRYLRIDEALERISEGEIRKIYSFQSLASGRLELLGEQDADDSFQRIWLVSGQCYQSDLQTINFQAIYPYVTKNFVSLLSKQQDLVSLELFVRKDLK